MPKGRGRWGSDDRDREVPKRSTGMEVTSSWEEDQECPQRGDGAGVTHWVSPRKVMVMK